MLQSVMAFSKENTKNTESDSKELISTIDQQQKVSIKGNIKDVNGEPIIGATILEKNNSQNGTISDIDGNFSLEVPRGAILEIRYIGYLEQDISIDNREYIDVTLSEDIKALDELIVVGYGTVKKSDLTGSVQRVDADIFKNQSMSQITDMLAGTVAGFNSVQSSSAAGGGSMEIRGRTSLNASTEPMIVLDGSIFNGSLRDVNPQDVETMEILKDASSSAIYGARAANGVVIITTQKGKKGKPTISFSTQVGVSNVTNKFKPYDKDGYLVYKRDLLRSKNSQRPSYYYDDPTQLPDGVSLNDWRTASANPQEDNTKEWLTRLNFFNIEVDNYLNGKTIDWLSETIGTGVRQKYDLSISGGTDKASYYWSIDYQDNGGVLKGENYSALRTRLNFDFEITDWLSAGLNTHFSDRDEGYVPTSTGNAVYYMSPYGSQYEEDGSLKWYPNDFALTSPLLNYYEQEKHRKVNSLFATAYTNIKLPFNINYKLSFQPNYVFANDYNFWPSTIPSGGVGGRATRVESKSFSWILDHLINWKAQFDKHSLDVTLLYSAEKNSGWNTTAENQTFVPNENLGFSGLKYGTNPSVGSNDTQTTADAVMARVNYSFIDRYLLTASVRRDGYSAFGVQNPRATFPAFAFAWKLSDEPFFNIPNVYQLKLRTSWGRNGNREIGAYSALAQLNSVQYYNGSNVQIGVYNNTLPNNELKWEKTESFNFGLDLGLFENKIDFAADFYVMNTFDLLMSRQLPEITGFSSIMTNLGEIRNKGLELTLNTVNMDSKNFRWTSSLVYSANRNEIVKLFGDFNETEVDGKIIRTEVPDYSNGWFPGQAIDRIWDYKIEGIWQMDEKEAAEAYGLSPGDWKATDVNDDGKYEALKDKQFIGYEEPRHRLGFRNTFDFLKNFSASFFIRADLGHSAPFSYALQSATADTGDRRNNFDIPYWTPDNPINDYPRLIANTSVYGGGISIYKPRTFVRLQDVSLSYSIPTHLIKPLGINNLEIYYSGHNLLYFSKWPGWDPESLNTPMNKSNSFGVRLSL